MMLYCLINLKKEPLFNKPDIKLTYYKQSIIYYNV